MSTPETQETEVQSVAADKGFKAAMDRYFGISKLGSSVLTEVFAGLTTFLAMAYILTVNPSQIITAGSSDPLWASVFIATALGAVIGCLLMAFLAKMPLAQAPGMGVNAMIGGMIGVTAMSAYGVQFSFGNAMAITLLSGVLFLLLTVIPCGRDKETGRLIGVREKIFEGVPEAIRIAIPVGIGLFIAFIGMQNSGLVITNGFTQVSLVKFNDWGIQVIQWGLNGEILATTGEAAKSACVALISLFAIAVLSHYKVKGSVILGVLIATIIAIPMGVANVDILTGNGGVSWKFWENFQNFFSMDASNGGSFLACFTEGFNFPENSVFSIIVLIITFCMLDMFDTMGTVVGCCSKAGLLDENGKPVNFTKTMLSDSIATCAGALLGTSTVTTFVESGTGIAAGGKTGMTALTVAVMFFLAIFILPVFAFIPSAAAAGALMYVGVLMMSSVTKLDFTNLKVAVPAFITIIMMPLAYSITGGIGLGIISYVIINVICYVVDIIKYAVVTKKGGEAVKPVWPISIVTAIITVFFLIYFFVPTKI
ncbi:MAG: NCS2 family permease [Candidatus Coproplasma sp.]